MRKVFGVFFVSIVCLCGISLADSSTLVDEYIENGTQILSSQSSSDGENNKEISRTVISAVPKTGPSINLLGIIIATLVIFGGYIYIKKRADI